IWHLHQGERMTLSFSLMFLPTKDSFLNCGEQVILALDDREVTSSVSLGDEWKIAEGRGRRKT
ncbi:hypothetical protein TorRG33x02_104110, partial [Trema orientale]